VNLLLILLLASPAPSEKTGQQAFEAAIQREASGDYSGAAKDLERLAREKPDDSFADDALFEAAVLAEERLSDPAHAAKLYDEVATRYPQSRLARRARTRADFLSSSLRTGEAPLAEYQKILAEGARDPRAAIARMEKLLAEHPDFALADRALFWLGSRLVEAGRESDGVARFAELESRFPASEWARRAQKSRADLLLKHGKTDEARGIYEALSRTSDPIARAAGAEGLRAVGSYRRSHLLVDVALAYLLIFVGFQLWTGRKFLLKLPTELLYYLPVAIVFAGAGATENAGIGWATFGIACGGAVITWVVAAGTAARSGMSMRERMARAVGLALAVLGLAYVAIQWTGLADLVLETLRNGPER
jgi:outer membrane protein assembly factor BamD (BamD/ComL family)